MEPTSLYKSLANGEFIQQIFPYMSEPDFLAIHNLIKDYIRANSKGLISSLLRSLTGANVMITKKIAGVAQIEYQDVSKGILSVNLILLNCKTPESIHEAIFKGVKKGIGENFDIDKKSEKSIACFVGFCVLYAAIAWNNMY
jgi:hypothetical protein